MNGAGRRDRLIAFKRATIVHDDYNQEIETYAQIGRAWARVHWGAGSERRSSAQEVAEQSATFVVVANTMTRSLTMVDRVSFDGLDWNIRSIAKPDRAEIEITAVARARETA